MKTEVYSEKFLERKLVEEVKRNKGWCIKLLCNHVIGLPDRLCLFPNSRALFAEVKTTGEKPRRSQELIHDRLRRLGFQVYIVDKPSIIQDIIDYAKRD
jgi:hypothetical protein